jgi:2-polyprenyl-3-methyl-5-hydroxy-6-metoxy-1,4-benzoquinol methylase
MGGNTISERWRRFKRSVALWLLDSEPGVAKPMQWTPETVTDFWTAFSRTRLTELSFARGAAKPLLSAIRHHLEPGARCLDFGAGSGHLIDALLGAGFQAGAFEPAAGRRETIQAQFDGRPGFLGVVGLRHDEQYQVVFALEVIEHILEPQFDAMIGAMVRFVAADGLLVLTTPHNEDLELGGCICPNCGTLFHRWQHVRSFTPTSLEEALRRHGIEPVVTHLLDFNPAHYADLVRLDEGAPPDTIPQYLRALRADQPIRIGAETSILFLGRRSQSRR